MHQLPSTMQRIEESHTQWPSYLVDWRYRRDIYRYHITLPPRYTPTKHEKQLCSKLHLQTEQYVFFNLKIKQQDFMI